MRRLLRPLIGGLVFLSALTAALPFLRLRMESEAARRDGLLLTLEEVAKSRPVVAERENAMTLILPLYKEELGFRDSPGPLQPRDSLTMTLQGFAGHEDRERAIRFLTATKELTRRWRIAAAYPKFESGTEWATDDPIRKSFYLVRGKVRLLAAASLGMDPKANLIGAARLSRFMRQDPGIASQANGLRFTDDMLRIARKYRAEKAVAQAIGPPSDPKLIYQSELSQFLGQLEMVKDPEYQKTYNFKPSFSERIRQLAPFDAAARSRVIRAWREVWNRLPNRVQDYEAASTDIDRILGAMGRTLYGYSSYIDGWVNHYQPGTILRYAAFLEKERQVALRGRQASPGE